MSYHTFRTFQVNVVSIRRNLKSHWNILRCGLWEVSRDLSSVHQWTNNRRFSHTVHDATAKITSGLLNGNVNQFGDYDQCLSVKGPNEDFQGKYCLTYLQPTVPKSLRFSNHVRKLLQSHEAFKSKFDDVSSFKFLLSLKFSVSFLC